MAENIHEFTEDTFGTEVLEADGPVLVDFWAPWCGPCRMLMPTIEQLAREYDGKVKIGKVNTDENGGIAANYGISSIPTIILFDGGEIVDKVVGAPPKEVFTTMLDKAIA